MRIRTVKPEFWTHPVMGRLDPEIQLLALALLNYADDHGYFRAEPSLVRSACRPFSEDSLSIHCALITLAEVGWLETCDSGGNGIIGRITTWEKHQRVNRPSDSKLARYWLTESSVNPHRAVRDLSVQEQGTGKGKESPIVPKGDEAAEEDALLLRAKAIFRMRPGTALDRSMRRAWKEASAAIAGTSEAEWQTIEAYYSDVIASRDDIRRRDLATLLNNWSGELTRAAAWAARTGFHPENSQKKETGGPPEESWRAALEVLYPEGNRAAFRDWRDVPESLRVEILTALAAAEKEAA
jgi:hypothetical protein